MPIEILELNISARVCDQKAETASEANRRSRSRETSDDDCATDSAARRAARAATEILNRKNER